MKIAIGIGDLRICRLGVIFDRQEVLLSGRPLLLTGKRTTRPGLAGVIAYEAADLSTGQHRGGK